MGGEIYEYNTNILNQYTNLSGGNYTGDNEKSFIYDNNGNITQTDKYKFQYDYLNRIIEIKEVNGQLVALYDYDILGRRIKKTSQNQTIEYSYSGKNVVQEQEQVGTGAVVTKSYINGLGLDNLIAYELGDQLYYFQRNHLGSVIGLTDNSGNLVIEYDYDEFGATFVKVGNLRISIENYGGNDYNNNRLFTGREWDRESGLYYLRARYYDSELGRFISRDPIGIIDQVNLYTYVDNNSIKYIDPTGEILANIIGGVVSVGLGAGIELISSHWQGRDFEYSLKDAGIDFVGGAIGAGIFTKINNISKVAKTADYGIDLIYSVASDYLKDPEKELCLKGISTDLGKNVLSGIVGNYVGNKVLQKTSHSRGARYIPNNLTEKLAMESVMADPSSGKILPILMTDPLWSSKDGWVKMSQNINGIEIHYVYNTITGKSADFKFK